MRCRAGDIDTYNQPYLGLETRNLVIINTRQERGRMWDVYVRVYTDASYTTPMNLASDLEVHYVRMDNDVSTKLKFIFPQGTNEYYLGSAETITNLVGTKYTTTVDYGLLDTFH